MLFSSLILLSLSLILRSTADASTDVFQWDFGENGKVKWSNNCDFNGGDVGNVQSSEKDCGRLCFERPDCKRFVWNRRDDGTCWFKSGNTEATGALYVSTESSCGYVIAQKTMNTGSSQTNIAGVQITRRSSSEYKQPSENRFDSNHRQMLNYNSSWD